MASFQKYFLALVPEGDLQERVTALKMQLKEEFNCKYALKSPAHVTLKMPFSYNEAKEESLIQSLSDFLKNYKEISLKVGGVGTFGDRVIYLKIDAGEDLFDLQRELKLYCKRELKLVDELSDRNFHPHMTIAFKDLKKAQIPNILEVLKMKSISYDFVSSQLFLLKRENRRWEIIKKIDFGG
ncbi:2'-5' RNA ligase family protein [Algoriphagus pacificus]|uniref:2'-5' RNA ligase family protein n=1 Tax=Algoriphagus pacificus TaxID=2811234 RepID=A0ABS3CCH7_9BACT|nr:2'-5' RNA ligase family protein [Algoriphagus pacificus]MBN7814226.1 2'-5' RNA ligase family protein [Algoriphagus pacificus]